MDTAEQSAPNNEPVRDTAPARKKNLPIGPLAAEFIGTFLLAGVIITTSGQPLYIFLAIAALVAILGGISGAHLNPALTIGAAMVRRLTPLRALGYILAQIIGAMLAFITLSWLLGGVPDQPNAVTGQMQQAELFKAAALTEGKEWYAFFAEILGASILGFAVAHALTEKRERFTSAFSVAGGLMIGLILAGSTAILNPAVALSLQALKFELWPIAVHVIAPIIGAIIGFLIFKLVEKSTPQEPAAQPIES
ncbi:MAG TPA: aquaporin [Verrucomicrobiae bacterium]|nr:aquaporin [Verrucomicrobiae bacterium]